MNIQDLIAKMQQIEQQAALTLSDYPEGWVEERQKLIAAIARQVRAHFEAEYRLSLAQQHVGSAEGLKRSGGTRQHG